MPNCFVPQCKTKDGCNKYLRRAEETTMEDVDPIKNIGMFRPQNEEMRLKWEDAIGQTEKKLTLKHVVCQLHFEDSQVEQQFNVPMKDAISFTLSRQRKKLKSDAVPSLLLPLRIPYEIASNLNDNKTEVEQIVPCDGSNTLGRNDKYIGFVKKRSRSSRIVERTINKDQRMKLENQIATMEESLDLEKICRVCLCESPQMYSIYSEILIEDTNMIEGGSCISQILMNISSMKIQPNDGLPSIICTKCINLAHSAFKFLQQCNQSQVILEEYLKNYPPMKQESAMVTETLQLDQDLLVEESVLYNSDCLISETGQVEAIELHQASIHHDFSDEENSECVDPLEINSSNVSQDLLQIPTTPQSIDTKTYPCKICGKLYKHVSSLNAHMRNHEMEAKPNACDLCGKKFTKYGSFLYHLKSHTGIRTHVCQICNKSYKQSSTLIAHMRVHTGQRPFLCSICGKGFRQAADLGYHMRTHTKERPYMCNVCGKTMLMQSHLVQHMRTHTGERPYKCTLCDKCFISRSALKRHCLIHTNLKPYSCDVCAKSFNRRGTLKVHAKIHTDERAHICHICNKAYIQLHALKSHMTTHTSEDATKTVK